MMLRPCTGVLKSVFGTGLPVPNITFYPSILCRAFGEDTARKMPEKVAPGEELKKSEWMLNNDKIFPPTLPNEEPRPAVSKNFFNSLNCRQ